MIAAGTAPRRMIPEHLFRKPERFIADQRRFQSVLGGNGAARFHKVHAHPDMILRKIGLQFRRADQLENLALSHTPVDIGVLPVHLPHPQAPGNIADHDMCKSRPAQLFTDFPEFFMGIRHKMGNHLFLHVFSLLSSAPARDSAANSVNCMVPHGIDARPDFPVCPRQVFT